MSLPNVVTYALAASSATNIVNAVGTISPGNFTLATTTLDVQRRITFTVAGNESGNTFRIIGLNQANMTVTENVTGPNTGTVQSNLDYKTLISIAALGTTAGTISIGTNGVGSCLWQIMNWHADPTDIVAAIVVQSGSANWSLQYTYDDPNNLPANVTVPTAFTHSILTGQTGNLDGTLVAPVSALRLLVNSGTGTIRGTIIQAGIGTP